MAGLAASLRSADGWEARASSAEEFAAATGRAVLGLGPAELAAVREKLLSDGVRRREELASAEQLAAAVFERALSGKLIEEAQRSKLRVICAFCASLLSASPPSRESLRRLPLCTCVSASAHQFRAQRRARTS